jgi:hypothetical protein
MGESWSNQFGVMKLADFRAGKHLLLASVDELPTGSEMSHPQFLESIRSFKEHILATDTIYFYDSHPSEWDQGHGSTGYALVRDGELFDTLVLRMN